MLSNAYFLAKFRFDTAENEPAKNLQNFAKFANFAGVAVANSEAKLARPDFHSSVATHAACTAAQRVPARNART